MFYEIVMMVFVNQQPMRLLTLVLLLFHFLLSLRKISQKKYGGQ